MIAYLTWNPNRVFFTIPYLEHPIVWYGVLFALGFLVTYYVLRKVFASEIFNKISLDESHVQDWNLLKKEIEKYPKLFNKDLSNRASILSQIEKYIKDKILPTSFYNPKILTIKKLSGEMTDRMTGYIVLGIIIGARLGYVFFYGWPLYKNDFWGIFKIWSGGLASHGACAGILFAAYLLVRRLAKTKLNFSFLHIMDYLAIISGFFSVFIRLGNFVNQEIVGLPTRVPWAILFLDPFDGSSIVPRHPVQLYEALFYLTVALSMYFLWKKSRFQTGSGLYAATFLISVFSFRFIIEFLKEPQGYLLPIFNGLRMGQYLSIPFVLVGALLILRYALKEKSSLKQQKN